MSETKSKFYLETQELPNSGKWFARVRLYGNDSFVVEQEEGSTEEEAIDTLLKCIEMQTIHYKLAVKRYTEAFRVAESKEYYKKDEE